MLTMTSLDAQSQFGNLIDASQREPITVTRRGRPVAVVMSYQDYVAPPQTISYSTARFISQSFGLQGKAAGNAMRGHLASMSKQAQSDGLTEADVMKMLNEG